MRSMIFLAVLFIAAQVNCQEASTEITSSGDGAEKPSMPTEVGMIDETGDIIGKTDEINPNDTIDSTEPITEKSSSDMMDSTITGSLPEITYVSTTTEPVTSTASTTTTESVTTTESATTKESTIPAEVTTEATTTETATDPTTMKAEVTTPEVTTLEPTSTTTSTTNLSTTVSSAAPVPAVGTTFIPDPAAKQCVFTDSNLVCNAEFVCYGEGEIDCDEDSEESNAASSQTTFMHKIALTSISEDATEGTIGTFPPDLIGVVSPKNKFPHLFKMGSLGTTDVNTDTTTEAATAEATTTKATTESATATGSFTSAKTSTQESGEQTSGEGHTDSLPDAAITSPVTELITATSEKATDAPVTSAPASVLNDMATENISVTTTVETVSTDSSTDDKSISTKGSTETEEPVLLRRRREDLVKNHRIEVVEKFSHRTPFKTKIEYAQGESQEKACKITGKLHCTPQPTTYMCKGKTYCQAVASTAETSEKSTSAKGVENWAIAVIAICAIAAVLTISLLLYLVITSWKKLKVQPQNGVTTLTYVNNTPA